MKQAIEVAKHYFELSNQRKLDEIKRLFRPSSTYSSETAGVFLGVDRIMQMQAEFFAAYEELHWQVQQMQEIDPGIVLFEFTFSGVTHEGATIRREGLETLIIFEGKIQHVEVRKKCTD